MKILKKAIVLRSLIVMIVTSFILSCTEFQAQGIHFETGDWDTILKQAKGANKLIFVDVFTTWCGPCKRMDKTIFTNEEVGAYFNTHFIPYKLDAEKGEGIALSKKYGVTSYPNLMFVDGNGKLVIRNGFMDVKQILEFGTKALHLEQEIIKMESEYNTGNRTPEFMIEYLAFLKERNLPTEEIALHYLEALDKEQWLSVNNLKLIRAYVHNPYNAVIEYLANRRTELANTTIGKQMWIPVILEEVYNQYLKQIIEERKDSKAISKLLSSYADLGLGSNSVAHFNFSAKRGIAKRDQDWDNYVKHTTAYVNTYVLDRPTALNNYAWAFYRNDAITDPKAMNAALGWINRALQHNKGNYDYLDTYAAVLYKLGRKEDALIAADKAVKIARETDRDPSETLKFIEKVKAN